MKPGRVLTSLLLMAGVCLAVACGGDDSTATGSGGTGGSATTGGSGGLGGMPTSGTGGEVAGGSGGSGGEVAGGSGGSGGEVIAGSGGSGGSGGSATGGGAGVAGAAGVAGTGGCPAEGPSCAGGLDCNGESCCTVLHVPGDTYERGADSDYPATVADFCLDKYEVTVGRFREFVNAYDGTPPPNGAGAHPLIAGSGWDSSWDSNLPADQAGLISNLKCNPSYATWTDTAGANETYPVNCLDWYIAFAFCAWDGGRLATEAEWEYAAGGGSDNWLYPWGNDATEPLPANYRNNHNTPFLSVGSEPAGNGRWGHSDLAGSMWEWTLDWFAAYTGACSNCANLAPATSRVLRGGAWHVNAVNLRSAFRYYTTPTDSFYFLGARCARSAP